MNKMSNNCLYMPMHIGVYHYLNNIKDTDEYTISDNVYKCCMVMGFLVYKWNVEKRKPFLCTSEYLTKKTYINKVSVKRIMPFLAKLGLIAIWYDDKGQRNVSINEEKIEQLDDEYREYANALRQNN